MVLPVFASDSLIQESNLNSRFFEGRPEKAEVWFRECININRRLDEGESFAIVAPTGGGKTVMALMGIAVKPRRTLFLVPMRRLAKRHQVLFVALGGNTKTRVITGESSKKDRQWNNKEDMVIFATGHIVVAELKNNPNLLDSFDLLVIDELHNAASVTHPYSQVALICKQKKILRLGLTASPGNNNEHIRNVLGNCCLNEQYKIKIPVSRQLGSVIHTEEVSLKTQAQQRFIEDFVFTEMQRLARVFNSQAEVILGKSSFIDPLKDVGYRPIEELRKDILKLFPEKTKGENLYLFSDSSVAAKLASSFEEYHKWEHIYNLVQTESFEAVVDYYQRRILSSKAWYAKRIIKSRKIERLINLTKNFIHPKFELLGVIMESLSRRSLQSIIFVSNKATAKGVGRYLSGLGFPCGLMMGGNSMKPADQELVLEQLEDRKIQCIIATTVLREGFNLSVDVIINTTPPKSAIDQIQRSGRAGRNASNAEILYLTTPKERPIVYSIDRNIRRLRLSDFSQFALSSSRTIGKIDSVKQEFQPSLF